MTTLPESDGRILIKGSEDIYVEVSHESASNAEYILLSVQRADKFIQLGMSIDEATNFIGELAIALTKANRAARLKSG